MKDNVMIVKEIILFKWEAIKDASLNLKSVEEKIKQTKGFIIF